MSSGFTSWPMSRSDGESVATRIIRGTTASFVGQLVYVGANALLIVLLTREFLSPAAFGRLFFALSVLGVVATFATVGLPSSTARYVTEYVERDPAQVRYLLRRSLVFLAVPVGVAGLLLVAVNRPLATALGDPTMASLLLVGGGYVVGYALTNYLSSVFRGLNQLLWTAVVTALSSVARLVLVVAFIVAGLGTVGALLGYIAGYAIAAGVGGIVLFWRYYRRFEETDSPDRSLPRRLLRYSVPLTVTKGAGALDTRVDSILVGVLLSPVAVGYYVVAKQVSSVVSTPAGSFGAALSPALGKEQARDETEHAARIYQSSLRHVLLFYVPAAAGLLLVAEPVVELVFGAAYLAAVLPLQAFTGVIVVQSVNKITTDTLDYLGRARDRAISKVVMAVSNVVLNLLLIPAFGVVGAVVATVITQTFYALANVYVINQVLPLNFRDITRDLAVIAGITAGMTVAVAVSMPYVSGLLSLVGVVLFGGVIWGALSVVSGLLDVKQIKAVFP